MQPRSEDNQRCLEFALTTEPRAQIMSYRDHLQNAVHHFCVPGRHAQLTITAEALIEITPPPERPTLAGAEAWQEIDTVYANNGHLDMLLHSHFARPSKLLYELAHELHIQRGHDPFSTLCHLNEAIYRTFEYVPHSTRVDSPIDDALRTRRGVCQDFAHIMITLVRELGIPCRYVSGYLFHRAEDHDRSEEDATHAWLEALLPGMGWVGFDPTNNLIVHDRHIRTAVGRDYADVPPTRGVFRGTADSELDVGVRVAPAPAPVVIPVDEELLPAIDWAPPDAEEDEHDQLQHQQAQQEQQQ